MTLCEFVSCEFVANFGLVKVSDPFDVVPQVFGPLHDCVFRLFEDEFGLKQQRLLAVREQLLLQLLHLVMIKQSARISMRKEGSCLSLQRICYHIYFY